MSTHNLQALDIDFDENEPMEERFLVAAAAWPGSSGVRRKMAAPNELVVELLERVRDSFEKDYGPSSVCIMCSQNYVMPSFCKNNVGSAFSLRR